MSSVPTFNSEEQHSPFDQGLVPMEQIRESQRLPDGSKLFDIGGQEKSGEEGGADSDSAFYENLAFKLSQEKLDGLAARLLDEIKQDRESRADWERTITLMMGYLGFKIEESRKEPFINACAAFDSTLATALIHFYSTARAELFPAAGPARSEIIGSPGPEVEDQGERVKMFLNWYLTKEDKDYYPDSERLLMYVGLFGCAFRKVYQDPVTNKPVARLVRPQDFIINHHTTSVETSDRMTETLYLTRKDILLRQQCKDFIKFEIPSLAQDTAEEESAISKEISKNEGVSLNANENKSLFKFFEAHVNLEARDAEPKKKKSEKMKDGDIPRPYIVTICDTTRKVVALRRNWKEEDDKYKRLKYYVHYYYMPGFGIYSLGLAHLMGSNAIVLTSLIRQLIDAGTLKNFPGGLRARGMRIENNDKAVGPGEWIEVETGGLPLSECITPMPYGEPSQVLAELRNQLKQETSTIAATAETEIPELGSNMPVGTTLALLEVANKVQSSVLRSLHVSLGEELKLIFDLFGEYLPDEPYPFAVPGKEAAIMRKDFNDKVNIVPVSDPNVLTSTHRLMRNEALLKLAQSNPEIHDMREAYHRMYQAMNVDNIDKLLPPPQPPMAIDPMTENMLVLSGKEITVQQFQEDDAHIAVHQSFLQNPFVSGNPQAYATLVTHIQKHKSYKAYKALYQQHKQKEIEQMIEQQMQPQMINLLHQGIPVEVLKAQMQPQMEEMMAQQMQQLPPAPEVPEDKVQEMMVQPEIQNMVAKQDAEEVMAEAKKQEEAAAQQLDPTKVMVMDIEQHREAAHLKSEADKLRAETEAFKAQLKFESEEAKTESQKEIAREKHEVDMLLAERKINKPAMEQTHYE